MNDRIRFILNRLGERLWVKPLAMCILSIAAVWLAKTADFFGIARLLPQVSADTIEGLLSIISASMLVIATFAVGSMVSSYAAATTTATPRSFALVIADDVSQNALSSFLGAFIFSIVALVALKNGLYGPAGRFALFCLTLLVFAAVILMFVRWVDSIARLGRMGTIMKKVEAATASALDRIRHAPHLGGKPAVTPPEGSQPVYSDTVGYVQRVDVEQLNACAEGAGLQIHVAALSGTFAMPTGALAYVRRDDGDLTDIDTDAIRAGFIVGDDRTFDEDPRFGLVALSEIASRALSPAVNDSGTAVEIIGILVRLFTQWSAPLGDGDEAECKCDRVYVPEVSVRAMFDDAFTPIARDGAGAVEVAVHLQQALRTLSLGENAAMRAAATEHARMALLRAEDALRHPDDLAAVRAASVVAAAG